MRTITAFFYTFILTAASVICLPSAFAQTDKIVQDSSKNIGVELDNFFKSTLDTQKYVGLGACLIRGDKIVWDGYYGYSDLEEKMPVTKDNIFQLASLSKTVTATALMQLYEKGLFNLDDDINNYMPLKVRNPNFPNKPITFRMLLTHTGSFEDVTSTGFKIPKGVERAKGSTGDSNIPFDKYIEELFTPGGKYYSEEYFSKYEPGTKYGYSNFAFSLLGFLVEKIAQKDFSDYCKENIFKPLGMNNTGWHLRDLDTNKIVFSYMLAPSDTISYNKIKHFGEPGYPAGMLRTTFSDFAKFLSIFTNKGNYEGLQLLKPETVQLMLTPQKIPNIPTRSFKVIDIGLVWLINEIEDAQLYSMNGFSGGIFTQAYFSVKDKTAIIYYFTGLNMKNMLAMKGITEKLYHAIKDFDI